MIFTGTREQIWRELRAICPDVDHALTIARQYVPECKREIGPFHAAALYTIAQAYDHPTARVLEIGTAQGYSAAVLALAMPGAHISTLNPKAGEYEIAVRQLLVFPNVNVYRLTSAEYLDRLPHTEQFDFIFVDGDHIRVAVDLLFWDRLKVGGLMFFHDYAPAASKRPCPPVYEVLDRMRAALGRDFDAFVMDERGEGMAGFERHAGEQWVNLGIPADFAPWYVEYEPVKRWVRHHDEH